jgi:hypothetical protein
VLIYPCVIQRRRLDCWVYITLKGRYYWKCNETQPGRQCRHHNMNREVLQVMCLSVCLFDICVRIYRTVVVILYERLAKIFHDTQVPTSLLQFSQFHWAFSFSHKLLGVSTLFIACTCKYLKSYYYYCYCHYFLYGKSFIYRFWLR